MPGSFPPPVTVRFDRYELDLQSGRLSRNGVKINLREKSFQVLALLLERAGEVVTREELRRRLWSSDVFVDFDNNLNITVARLREALRDSADHPRFIETVPKHGYRFLVTTSKAVSSARHAPAPLAKIVVLPLVNLSGDPAQDYFSDAMTDEIISALAVLAPEHLAVIARTTAMSYKGRKKDVAHIRRELGVDYLAEGALHRNDDRVGINVQLIQTSDQTNLFASNYEGPLTDIFRMQSSIAREIAAHVPEVADKFRTGQLAGTGVIRKPTEDLVAYNFYLLGRQQLRQGTPEPATVTAKIMRYYRDAIVRDPQFALAHAAIAEVCWWIGFLGLQRPKETFSAGMRAAQRAIEIDPNLGLAHALMGKFHGCLDYNWMEAGREMALALQLDPRCPETRFHYGNTLLAQGRIQEAIAEFRQGLELDPLSIYIRFWVGYTLYLGREYTRALEHFQFLIEMAPDERPELKRALDFGYTGFGLVYTAQGRLDDAISAFRRAVEASDGLLMRLGQLGSVLARNGNTAEARVLLQRAEAMAAESYFPPTCIAWIYLGLGDNDAAFAWLDRAIDERDPFVIGVNTGPLQIPLDSDPRFSALLRKMNLQP